MKLGRSLDVSITTNELTLWRDDDRDDEKISEEKANTFYEISESVTYYLRQHKNDFHGTNPHKMFYSNNSNKYYYLKKVYSEDEYCLMELQKQYDIKDISPGINYFNLIGSKDTDRETELNWYALILYIIENPKKCSNIVVQVENITKKSTLQLFYILTCLYANVTITKPTVCSYLTLKRFIVFQTLTLNIEPFLQVVKHLWVTKEFIGINCPLRFLNEVEQANTIYTSKMMLFHNQTYNGIETNKQLQFCLNWMKQYNPHNVVEKQQRTNEKMGNITQANEKSSVVYEEKWRRHLFAK
jgi:hypothetical protein